MNAGVPVEEVRSTSHEIHSLNRNVNGAKILLKNEKTIANRDFVLRCDVIGKKIKDAFLVHKDTRGGFFSLILLPPERLSAEDYTLKEIVFVLDTSGSMSGFPIEKAKESMKMALENLYPQDTFNLITFAGKFHIRLYTVVKRLLKGDVMPTENESSFVKEGKAAIEIELSGKTPEVLEKLKTLGFEITESKPDKNIVDSIKLENLAMLAEISEVQDVLPHGR